MVIDQKRKTIGSMLSVELTCNDEHVTHWDSHPTIKRKPVGNLLLEASILFTGNSFARVKSPSLMSKLTVNNNMFYDTQQRFLFPILNEKWENEQQMVQQQIAVKDDVNLNGEGCCDSHGHNAKYHTYYTDG